MAQQFRVSGVATRIYTNNEGVTQIMYHGTPVVSFQPVEGVINKPMLSVTLRADGWLTATTKTRMNQASNQCKLGFHVYQKNFIWYVRSNNEPAVEFKEGMTFRVVQYQWLKWVCDDV